MATVTITELQTQALIKVLGGDDGFNADVYLRDFSIEEKHALHGLYKKIITYSEKNN